MCGTTKQVPARLLAVEQSLPQPKPRMLPPLQEFKPGDRVRFRDDLDHSRRSPVLRNLTYVVKEQRMSYAQPIYGIVPPGHRHSYLVEAEADTSDEDGKLHDLNDYLFELVPTTKVHPPVKYDDLRRSNLANARKRKQLRLLQQQRDQLAAALERANAAQIGLVQTNQRLFNKLQEIRGAVTGETRGPTEYGTPEQQVSDPRALTLGKFLEVLTALRKG